MIITRGGLSDHYVEGDRSVVMVGESVLGLSPVATAILEAVPERGSTTLAAVTEHVVLTFGPPDGPESATDLARQQVWDLVAHEVLVITEDEKTAATDSSQLEGHGHALSGEERSDAVRALRNALRHLRSGDVRQWTLPDHVDPMAFVAAARAHHVVSFVAAHFDHLAIVGRARSEIEAMASRQRAGAALLAADLAIVLDALEAEGIRALAFKGVALATQAYDDFAIRGAGDLDLLVSPQDVSRAHRVLTDAGWSRVPGYPSPGPSWAWRHHVRTDNELTLSGTHSNVDLHWHLVPMRGSFPDFDTLWERHVVMCVDGHPIPTLGLYDALAHSAAHAAKDQWRWLRSLLDVHVLAARPETWRDANRPLRPEQLRSIGLATAEFGVPASSPPVVHLSMRGVDHSLRDRVRREQDGAAPQHQPLSVPGLNFLRRLRAIGVNSKSFVEIRRLVSESIFPSRFTTDENSPYAMVAVPRVLRRRASEVVSRLSVRRRTSPEC